MILIKGSYEKWQESPIETTITTHPLDDLDFPRVTVCPPKGSNTALNHDLMMADNDSFTNERRENLKEFVWKSFIYDQHTSYIEEMLALVTTFNIQSMYDGYQTVPKPYGSSKGFQITFETTNGMLKTPRFGDAFREKDFTQSKDLNYILDLLTPTRALANWSLVVELDVDVRESKSWREWVEIRQGPKYVYHTHRRNWKEAEANCQEEGGHLTSILSPREQKEVEELLEDRRADTKEVWFGASRDRRGIFQWSDGNDMNFTNWRNPEREYKCGFIQYGEWYRQNCLSSDRYICKLDSQEIRAKEKISLEYRKEQLISSQISVVYKYQSLGTPRIGNRTTGFQLTWFLKDANGLRIETPQQQSMSQRNSNIRKMIKLAAKARSENMTEDEIVMKAIEEKYVMGLKATRMISYDECTNGQIKVVRGRNPFDKINLGLSKATYQGDITTEDYVTGYKIYSILVFCNPETLKLGKFLYNMVSDNNLRTIIKVAVNTIQSDRVKEVENKNLLFGFYQHLEKSFNLELGRILLAVSSPSELQAMLIKNLPYITPFSNEIEACFNNKDCSALGNLVKGKLGLFHI